MTHKSTTNQPTPWAVLCFDHGQQFLTEDQYLEQLSTPFRHWECPVCGNSSSWDDDNYDQHFNELQGE